MIIEQLVISVLIVGDLSEYFELFYGFFYFVLGGEYCKEELEVIFDVWCLGVILEGFQYIVGIQVLDYLINNLLVFQLFIRMVNEIGDFDVSEVFLEVFVLFIQGEIFVEELMLDLVVCYFDYFMVGDIMIWCVNFMYLFYEDLMVCLLKF